MYSRRRRLTIAPLSHTHRPLVMGGCSAFRRWAYVAWVVLGEHWKRLRTLRAIALVCSAERLEDDRGDTPRTPWQRALPPAPSLCEAALGKTAHDERSWR